MRPDERDRRLRERLDALGAALRAELLHVLMLPDFDRVGEFWGNPKTRTFAEATVPDRVWHSRTSGLESRCGSISIGARCSTYGAS
jgi:hypothetical protein